MTSAVEQPELQRQPHDESNIGGGTGTAVVIGGGIAGITAALMLAQSGIEPVLIEKRPGLGGRANSYYDKEQEVLVDECQHGTMRCCTTLDWLLGRLGVREHIRYFDRLEFLDGDGIQSAIYSTKLPPPFHTAVSFMKFKSLSLADKVGIARALMSILLCPPRHVSDLMNMLVWLKAMGQTDRAISRFWRPILVSACNEDLDKISCIYGYKVFREGFLTTRTGYQFGIPTVPLSQLYNEPAIALINDLGGKVRTRTAVKRVTLDKNRRNVNGVVLQSGEEIAANWVVCALQCDQLARILPADFGNTTLEWEQLAGIPLVPIMGVHLWFDRPLDIPPAMALLDRKFEWVFNRSELYPELLGAPAFLSLVISASRQFEEDAREAVVELALRELREAFPQVKTATLLHSSVVRWPRATISPSPEVHRIRCGPVTAYPNLVLAGEWTDTGWPSTMEGAAISGINAAHHILSQSGVPLSFRPGAPAPEGASRVLMSVGEWLYRNRRN